jgi:hypothetical protein
MRAQALCRAEQQDAASEDSKEKDASLGSSAARLASEFNISDSKLNASDFAKMMQVLFCVALA